MASQGWIAVGSRDGKDFAKKWRGSKKRRLKKEEKEEETEKRRKIHSEEQSKQKQTDLPVV